MFDKRDANTNTPRKPHAKAMAAVFRAQAPANTEIRDIKATVASLAAMIADIIAELIITRKNKILDSGASMSIISDLSHYDPSTPYCRAEEFGGLERANQSIMAISGSRTINDLEGIKAAWNSPGRARVRRRSVLLHGRAPDIA